MTTTKIQDWKGVELLNDFIDYVNTGVANAKAIASQDTGSMVGSIRITKIANGFLVDANPTVLKRLSKQKDYYPATYVYKGYRRWQPFDFIMEGFNALDDNDSIGDGVVWSAKRGGNPVRNGSGTGNISGIKIPKRLRRSSSD